MGPLPCQNKSDLQRRIARLPGLAEYDVPPSLQWQMGRPAGVVSSGTSSKVPGLEPYAVFERHLGGCGPGAEIVFWDRTFSESWEGTWTTGHARRGSGRKKQQLA